MANDTTVPTLDESLVYMPHIWGNLSVTEIAMLPLISVLPLASAGGFAEMPNLRGGQLWAGHARSNARRQCGAAPAPAGRTAQRSAHHQTCTASLKGSAVLCRYKAFGEQMETFMWCRCTRALRCAERAVYKLPSFPLDFIQNDSIQGWASSFMPSRHPASLGPTQMLVALS